MKITVVMMLLLVAFSAVALAERKLKMRHRILRCRECCLAVHPDRIVVLVRVKGAAKDSDA
uniref:U24-Sparatoxin-Hju1br_1 n=1 Tax=Heteropoda jugulans TaxID=1358901 RepID=A0A4Q8K8I5_9ARAC